MYGSLASSISALSAHAMEGQTKTVLNLYSRSSRSERIQQQSRLRRFFEPPFAKGAYIWLWPCSAPCRRPRASIFYKYCKQKVPRKSTREVATLYGKLPKSPFRAAKDLLPYPMWMQYQASCSLQLDLPILSIYRFVWHVSSSWISRRLSTKEKKPVVARALLSYGQAISTREMRRYRIKEFENKFPMI